MPIKLTVSQPAPVSLSYVEAAIKPEVTGHVTPTYEEQTVYPAAGTTFGAVEVDAIPDPTGIKEIGSNGDHDVRRYGVARVDVQPTLQSKTATPTEQAQTVLPDTGYDGLESVNIARIPTEYIIPAGTKNITTNGTESVREYDSVNVNVPIPPGYIKPQGKVTITQNGTGIDISQYAEADVDVSDKPTKGFAYGDFDADGCPLSLTTYGYTELPAWFFYRCGYNEYNRANFRAKVENIYLNEGITSILHYNFRDCIPVKNIYFPSTLASISGTFQFAGASNLQLIDFSKCTAVPTLTSTNGFGAQGCIIRVPQSLLAEWQAATNWNALTGVIWEGV